MHCWSGGTPLVRTRSDLRPYQRRMCKLAYQNPHCGLLLKIGGGKTVITLTLAEYLLRQGDVRRVLVVGPLRVVNSVWQQEAEGWEHTAGLTFSLILGSAARRRAAADRNAQVYLVNVENFVWLMEHYSQVWKWDMVVCDEFSLFKNQSAMRSRALRSLRKSKALKRLIGLTGTPAANGLHDFWHQVWLLDRGQRLGRYKSTFMDRYFYLPPSARHNQYAKPMLRPGAQKEILRELLSSVSGQTVISSIRPGMRSPTWLTWQEMSRSTCGRNQRKVSTRASWRMVLWSPSASRT